MGGDRPKQYAPIGGKTVLAHAVDAMASHARVTTVRVVIGPGQQEMARAALGSRNVGELIVGGAERSDSVAAGLATFDDGIVLVHDAARPFCPAPVIDRLLDALEDADGAVPVLAVADTLARGLGRLEAMVDRANLLRVQTPQAFHVEDLRQALAEAGQRGATDESSVMVAAGLKVLGVEGDAMLDKLTNQADWARAEARLAAALVSRSASGFDVHAFDGPGPVLLGGVAVPHDRGLAGHSDADVLLHAITDALLGAGGFGDIGQHFPPSDPQWQGASSDRFVAHAAGLVRGAGGVIDFVDCTLIGEAPRLSPHRDAIRASIADILALPIAQISVKATTTEGLGFTGRREGLAAQAVATIRMPA